MPSASERNKVLGIVMRAKDQLTPALRAARTAVGVFRRVATGAFRAVGRVARLAGRAIAAITNPLNILRALMLGLPIVAIVRSFGQLAEQMDDVAKRALRLNIGVEALQELQFAADIAGVEFEQLAVGMQRMARRVADAAAGNKGLQKTMAALNLDAEKLSQLPLEDQFTAVGRAIGALDDSGEQLLRTFQLFDTEGVALLQLFRQGEDAVARLRQEARELGIVLDRDAIARFEQWHDAMTRLRAAFRGIRLAIAVEFAPLIVDAAERVKEFFVDRREDIRVWAATAAAGLRFAGGALSAFITLLGELAQRAEDEEGKTVFGNVLRETADLGLQLVAEVARTVVNLLINVLQTILRPALEVASIVAEQIGARLVKGMVAPLAKLPFTALKAIRGGFEALINQLGPAAQGVSSAIASQLFGEFAPFIRQAPEIGEGMLDAILAPLVNVSEEKIQSVEASLGEIGRKVLFVLDDELKQSGREIIALTEGVNAAFKEFADDLRAIGGPEVEAFLKQLDALKLQYQELVEAAKAARDAAGDVVPDTTAAEQATDAAKTLASTWRDVASSIQNTAGRAIDGVIDNAIDGTLELGATVRDVGRDILSTIAKIVAQAAALSFTRLFFPDFGGPSITPAAKGGIFQGGLRPVVRAFQAGGLTPGIVDRPTLALVGEGSKREAVVPLPDGRSIPVRMSGGGDSGNREVHVTFAINANDTKGFDALLHERSDLIEELIQRAMASRRSFREQVRSIAGSTGIA